MTSPTIRAVFFDAVGTLLHPEPDVVSAYSAIGSRYGSRLSTAEISARFRRAFRHEEEIDRAANHRTDAEREVQRWRRIVGSVFDDVNDSEACFRALFEHFAQPSAWRCGADVAPTLRALSERGLLVGMASNFDTRLHHLVTGLPELAAVSRIVVSSEVGWKKPAVPFFDAVVQASGARAEEILFVGDDVDNDYVGATNAGMAAVLLDAEGSEDGRRHIRRLTEVIEFAACGLAEER